MCSVGPVLSCDKEEQINGPNSEPRSEVKDQAHRILAPFHMPVGWTFSVLSLPDARRHFDVNARAASAFTVM